MTKIEQEKKENQDLLQRIKDRLDGDDGEENLKKDEKPSFLDKITGRAEEEERRRKEEANKNAFEKFGDCINEGLGGGKKAEEKEDFLDKSKWYLSLRVIYSADRMKLSTTSRSTSCTRETRAMRVLSSS